MPAANTIDPTQRNRDFWFTVSRYLLGIEILLQTSLFTLLMILQMKPAIAIATCAILLIAGRIAAKICKSRIQNLDIQQTQPIPAN